MRPRSTIGIVVLALLGLVLAAAITLAASSLTSQRVGLSAEPLSAGNELVPETTTPARGPARTTTTRTTTTPASTTTTPAAPPTATTDDRGGDDHSGAGDEDDSGRGRGRGRGGDD